jgi:hypothetical protein
MRHWHPEAARDAPFPGFCVAGREQNCSAHLITAKFVTCASCYDACRAERGAVRIFADGHRRRGVRPSVERVIAIPDHTVGSAGRDRQLLSPRPPQMVPKRTYLELRGGGSAQRRRVRWSEMTTATDTGKRMPWSPARSTVLRRTGFSAGIPGKRKNCMPRCWRRCRGV